MSEREGLPRGWTPGDDRRIAAMAAHVEALEGALRLHHANVWANCAVCDRPIGAALSRGASHPGLPRRDHHPTVPTGTDTWVRTRTEGVNDEGQPFVEFRGTRLKGENDEEA